MRNSWFNDTDFNDVHWDYRYGSDDTYVNRKVEKVIMPHDLEIARLQWEQKMKAKRKVVLV